MSTILISEQTPMVRELLAALLQANGHITLTTDNAAEAIEMVQGCGVCLAVLDAGLAEKTVMDWSQTLREGLAEGALPLLVLADQEQVEGIRTTAGGAVQAVMSRGEFVAGDFLALCERFVPSETNESPSPLPATKTTDSDKQAKPSVIVPTPKIKPATSPAAPAKAPAIAPDIDELKILKTLTPLVDRPTIDRVVHSAHQLAVPPPVLQALKDVLDNPSAERSERSTVISLDVALCFRVMAMANALNGNSRKPVESIQAAVDRLGVEKLRLIASQPDAEAVKDQNLDDTRSIEPDGYWMHAHAVSVLCAEITKAMEASDDDVEAARTAGLLHDAGRLVLARHLPEQYAETIETSVALDLPLHRVEQQMMLDDHAQFMDKAMHRLKFGPQLLQPAACHHMSIPDARNLAGRNYQEVAVLMLAERLAAGLLAGDHRFDPLCGADPLLTALKIEPDKMQRAITQSRSLIQEGVVRYAHVMDRSDMEPAKQQLIARLEQPVRPMFVGRDSVSDPVAVFAHSAWVGSEDAPPNLALVHITNVRDREALTGQLRSMEFERNVTRLPVLTISPKGNLTLDPNSLTGRETRELAEPVTLDKLVLAFNHILQPAEAQAA